MTQAALSARLLALESWRVHLRELDHEKRIRALELAWAKVAGAALGGSMLGGALLTVIVNTIGGHA